MPFSCLQVRLTANPPFFVLMRKAHWLYIPLMKSFIGFFLLCVLSLSGTVASAQPNYYGCHSFKRKAVKPHAPTAAEKILLNESIARSDTFDIIHYVINIDVTDYVGQLIKASTTVAFTPLMSGQEFIRFDLFQLTVDSVSGPNGALTFAYDDEILRVNFDEIPTVGEIQEVTVHYHGTPHRDPNWGGFYFESQYIYNLGIGLTTVPPNFGKVWYPCFDSFVERATYEYHVKSSGTYRAICQGTFLGEQQLLGDTIVRSYILDQPIPTHISAIAVANYQVHEFTHTGQYGDVPVTLAAKAAQLNTMVSRYVNLGAAIDACEYWYGPQPFDRVGYVLTTDGALEIPTNIAIPEFMTGQTEAANRSLYSHELGHHWWGDKVTMHNHTDMWMKEGPAEYSSHLVTEWLLGREEFVREVKDNQLYVLEEAHIADDGFQTLSGIEDEQIYGVHTYNKGAAAIHNLRGYLGDELFRQGMSGVQANHGWRDFTAEEFREVLEEEAGVDLDAYFDAWIFAPGFSVFVVDSMQIAPDQGAFNVNLFIQQQLRATSEFHRDVPIDLTFIGSDWQREEHQITVNEEFSEVAVTCAFEPVMAVLNGHTRLNQGRMDREIVITPDVSFGSILPYVEFRLYAPTLVDSSLVRIEHIWAGPDTENLGPGVFAISANHYWNVDGIWPEGNALEGRIYYDGSDAIELDSDLYGVTEADAVLVYRESAAHPWRVYTDYTLSAGNLTNGTGNFRMDVLRKGQYAFANGDPAASVEEGMVQTVSVEVFPIPASDWVRIKGSSTGRSNVQIDIFDQQGRKVLFSSFLAEGTFSREIELSELAAGNYIIQLRDASGAVRFSSALPVVR